MSSEQEAKLPISKVFWALMALNLVTFLVGISSDDTAKYREGLNELREIQKLSGRIDSAYQFVSPEVVKQLGENPISVISEIVEKSGRTFISANVLSSIEYFLIDQGPLKVPSKINDLYERFQKDISYTVRAPSVIQLKASLSESLGKAPDEFKLVSDIDIACNWPNLRCNVSITLNDDPAESSRHHKKFKIDAVVLNLKESTFWSKVMAENSYFNEDTITLKKIEKILYDVYDLNIDQAIKQLNVKLSSTKGDVSALGVSIKSESTLPILPLLILALMFFLLVGLRELGEGYDESQYLDTPLFYETNLGVAFKWITFIAFPIVTVATLVVRFFDIHSVGSWFGGLFMMGVIASAWLIKNELLHLSQKKPNKQIQPTAGSGG